ncbi:hypothetical protein D8674_031824 [Pyrus ussuriensis x Pyrus communis]|uniref:Uncharacterized protein n=1 Tax=Pyrus ussuriensis x Pyrus communis TaxID=2448454 RepID=A0A5N5FD56_9ROSA|nr:hypothetical protein D8674_031824 [Pyrus ussuriensis x Pyrus communis]
MGNPRRIRKRVRAIRRAPDGSAFWKIKCNSCGASVPIALAGMHECEFNENVKRFSGVSVDVKKQSIWDQLVIMAPFHFFLKEFTKASKAGNWVAINREGFEAWKNDKAYWLTRKLCLKKQMIRLRPVVHEFTSWNWKMVHGF